MKPFHFRILLLNLCLLSSVVPIKAQTFATKIVNQDSAYLFIENEYLKLGIDTAMGGAITYLAMKSDGINMINDHDLGRQVQISFFAGPKPFSPSPDKLPHPHWTFIGWNPIQAGDVYGYGSKIKDLYVGDDSLFVSCIPMHWPLENVPGECIYGSSIKLQGNKVFATVWMENKRADSIQYDARSSEFPAVYTNGPYYRLFTYAGDKPFTGDKLTLIPKKNYKQGEFPWNRFQATENWAALVNEENIGVGVFSPVTQRFLGGFTGKEGVGGTFDAPCGYISPVGFEVLDHNIFYTYEYILIAGELNDIRDEVYHLSKEYIPAKPCFDFRETRQGWYYTNARDSGWPVRGKLEIYPDSGLCSIVGPDISFKAEDVSALKIDATIHSGTGHMFFEWNQAGSGKKEKFLREIRVLPDKDEIYRIDLKRLSGFTGLITGVRITFKNMDAGDDKIILRSICFE